METNTYQHGLTNFTCFHGSHQMCYFFGPILSHYVSIDLYQYQRSLYFVFDFLKVNFYHHVFHLNFPSENHNVHYFYSPACVDNILFSQTRCKRISDWKIQVVDLLIHHAVVNKQWWITFCEPPFCPSSWRAFVYIRKGGKNQDCSLAEMHMGSHITEQGANQRVPFGHLTFQK